MQPHEIWIEPRRQLDQYFFVRQVVHGASYPQTRFSYYTPAVRLASPAKTNVIPGRPEGPGPESITPALRSMDSGLAASRRRGMTNNNPAISEMAEGGALENKRLAAGPDKPGELARLDFPDLAHRDIRRLRRRAEPGGRGRRHAADDLVVVATGERGLQQGRLGGEHGLG